VPEPAHPNAAFLPEGCEFVLVHCGQSMDCGGSRSTWQGSWPSGTQTVEVIYGCQACGTTATVKVVEPDQPRPTERLPRLPRGE
jgi:hypothetical protein